jgi:hypothetical protein
MLVIAGGVGDLSAHEIASKRYLEFAQTHLGTGLVMLAHKFTVASCGYHSHKSDCQDGSDHTLTIERNTQPLLLKRCVRSRTRRLVASGVRRGARTSMEPEPAPGTRRLAMCCNPYSVVVQIRPPRAQ